MQTIIKGAIEDHLGRVLHPDTEADQVSFSDGKNAEQKVSEILARFGNYLPLIGGIVDGAIGTVNGSINVNEWGIISTGTNGNVMIANNAYINPINNTYHFAKTHSSIGAKGILLQNGNPGIMYFDTGIMATTADAAFNPNFKPLVKRQAELAHDLNNIVENTIVDCTTVTDGPGADWYFVQHISHSSDAAGYATQIAYAFNSEDVKRRRKVNGAWQPWESLLTQSATPAHYYATWEPLPTDGKDGDSWDVYA